MIESELVEPYGSDKGYVYEMFSGIQGEGLLVGERQIFVRFAGCNLDCAYCDTPAARVGAPTCRIEQQPGLRDFITLQNPLKAEEITDRIKRLEVSQGTHRSVSLTGGEPLQQAQFASSLASELKRRDFRVFLETNGTLPDALINILPFLDVISMDVKLPSAGGGPDMLKEHRLFLERSISTEVYIKIVVTSGTSASELLEAVEMVKSVDPEIPVVLQPVTPRPGVIPPSPTQILELQTQCMLHLHKVRVIPQCHKVIGQL